MNRRLFSEVGKAEVQITGAYPEDFLSELARQGIRFRRLSRLDPLTLRLTLGNRDMDGLRRCAGKHMCDVQVRKVTGPGPALLAMGWRMLYWVLLLGITLSVFHLQKHILFFRVSGNQTMPEERILRTLEEQGIGFWTRSDTLDLNTLKNRTLSRLPELGWITINVEGATAEVIVREREEKPVLAGSAAPADLVSAKDGLILEVTPQSGTPQVAPGDLVQRGQVLISGVTDLDRTVLLTRAEGEIYARTWTQVKAILPENRVKKEYTGRQKVLRSLTVGKNTINFYKTSGISYEEYDKIIDTKTLTLPGGYSFPLSVTRISLREYRVVPMETENPETLLERSVLEQLRQEITGGTVTDTRFSCEQKGQAWVLGGTAECREEIGRISEIKE